jgi:hypothetical protein
MKKQYRGAGRSKRIGAVEQPPAADAAPRFVPMERENRRGVEGHAAIALCYRVSDQVANEAGPTGRLSLSRPQVGIKPGRRFSRSVRVPTRDWPGWDSQLRYRLAEERDLPGQTVTSLVPRGGSVLPRGVG